MRRGDWTIYDKISRGLQVRTRMYSGAEDGAKVASETRLTQVSRAKLGDELFTIPADFRQVTFREFQEAQSRAMMESLTGKNQ